MFSQSELEPYRETLFSFPLEGLPSGEERTTSSPEIRFIPHRKKKYAQHGSPKYFSEDELLDPSGYEGYFVNSNVTKLSDIIPYDPQLGVRVKFRVMSAATSHKLF